MSPLFGVAPNMPAFMRSTHVPEYLKQQWLEAQVELGRQFPIGAQKWAAYGNLSSEQDLQKRTILSNVTKSRAEQGVVALEALKFQIDQAPQTGSAISRLLQAELEFKLMRDEGIRLYTKLGPAFDALWQKLGYSHSYGPLSIEDAGPASEAG